MKTKDLVFELIERRSSIPVSTESDRLAFPYLDSGLIDSLGLVELIAEIEDKFGILFQPEHLQSDEFLTIGGLIAIIERLLSLRQQLS